MKRLLASWDDFWLAPEPTSTLAVVRVAYGALLLAWAAMLGPDLSPFFSTSGILPAGHDISWAWSLLDAVGSDAFTAVVYWLLVASAVGLVLGYRTRLAAVVAFVGIVSLYRRNPAVFQGGDHALRVFSFYFMFAPAGCALSLDRWRRARDNFWQFPERAPWALRLIQVQLSLIYLFTVWIKARGTTWNDGTAFSYSVRIGELVRLELPAWMTTSVAVSNVATYSALAVEFAMAVLVWNRRARPWVLTAGVLLHLAIEVTIRVGFFSLAMLLYYLAWLDPQTVRSWLLSLARRWRLAPLEAADA
ncbi:MAG TPA: HTTM domain-containing protein [Acidimicrobiales bacterium]|nr:HTTM domain-containing protein [Acidimicrobiales bacterium]